MSHRGLEGCHVTKRLWRVVCRVVGGYGGWLLVITFISCIYHARPSKRVADYKKRGSQTSPIARCPHDARPIHCRYFEHVGSTQNHESGPKTIKIGQRSKGPSGELFWGAHGLSKSQLRVLGAVRSPSDAFRKSFGNPE